MNDHTTSSRGRRIWLTTAAALTAVTLLSFFAAGDSTWERPDFLFSATVTGAALCILAATIVIAVADRRDMAEVGLLGAALMAASVLPLVHGLVTPDVIYNDSSAFRVAMFLTFPIAIAVAAPLLTPRSAFGRWAARHWRDWTLLALLGVFITSSVVVFFPDAVSVPGPGSPASFAVSFGLVVALGLLSRRQLGYHELGGHPANLIAALAMLALAAGSLLPLVSTDYGLAFWWLHAVAPLGVLAASTGLVISKRLTSSTQNILAPVLVRDPLAAFELGLSPLVHRFVADLEAKDEITRDHVVRTAEMALRVGERFQVKGADLRSLGLAALLHDVGKLEVPDEILKKPAALTPDEYEIVKHHVVQGAEWLRAEPSLACAADIVRAHHERVDGAGYPDGLAGTRIPLAARIIAVCDAFDAMTNDRQYRTGMSVKLAYAVLQEHSGSQWDAEVVKQLIAVLPSMPMVGAFDAVGRDVDPHVTSETIPDDIGELLAMVDAEI